MYDLDRIMTRAWETYRNGNADFAEALHSSWVTEKETVPESDSPASETEGESETRYGNEKRSYLKMMDNETVNQTPKNVVVADCQSGNYSVRTDPIWQYDYGIVLQIQGVELPSAYEVHFSNDPLGFSKTQIGDENGVRIPDEYLLTGQMVYAWLFLHEGAEDGETRLSISIPVRRRAMPLDVEPTNVEQSVITQAIAALNQAVDETESAAAEVREFEEKLPHITASDNGKYLRVDDETIVTADLSTVLIVKDEPKTISNSSYRVLDKTFAEIKAAPFAVIVNSISGGGSFAGDYYFIHRIVDVAGIKTIEAVAYSQSGGTISLANRKYSSDSDDDYPKMAL